MPPKKKSTAKLSRLEALLKYTFAALLIFIPLYPKFPLFFIPGSTVAVRAEDTILAFLALLLFLYFFRHYKLLTSLPYSRHFLLFWLIGLLSLLNAIFVTQTVTPHLGLLHWARRLEYMLPFFAGFLLARQKSNLVFFTKIIPIVSLGVFGYGLAQLYLQFPVIITQNEEYSKGIALTLQPGVNLASTFAGHYDLATYLVMTLSLLTALTLSFKKIKFQLLSLLLLAALFWLQLQAGSRVAILALVISLSLVFLLARRLALILPMLALVILGVANTPTISGRFSNFLQIFRLQFIQDQVKGVFETRGGLINPIFAASQITPTPTPTPTLRPVQQDRSTSIRFDVEWPRAARALAQNPFLGTGYSSITLATDNDYLRALGETGILGFFSWVSILIYLFADLVRGLKAKLSPFLHHYLIGSTALFVGFLTIAFFLDIFEASKVATLFWMYTGLASGISNSKGRSFRG